MCIACAKAAKASLSEEDRISTADDAPFYLPCLLTRYMEEEVGCAHPLSFCVCADRSFRMPGALSNKIPEDYISSSDVKVIKGGYFIQSFMPLS